MLKCSENQFWKMLQQFNHVMEVINMRIQSWELTTVGNLDKLCFLHFGSVQMEVIKSKDHLQKRAYMPMKTIRNV